MTNSIVDLLKSQGKDSSFASRAALYGAWYKGTAQQNTELIQKLSAPAQTVSSTKPVVTPAPSTPYVSPNMQKSISATPAPAQDYGTTNILPESVTGIKQPTPAPSPAPTIDQNSIDPNTGLPSTKIDQVKPSDGKNTITPLPTPITTPAAPKTPNQDKIDTSTGAPVWANPIQGQKMIIEQTSQTQTEQTNAKATLANILAVNPESKEIDTYIQRYPSMKKEILAMQTEARYNKNNQTAIQNLIKTPEWISEAVSSGMIIPGTEAWNTLAANNPDLINQWAIFEKRKIVTDLINGTYQVSPFDPNKVSGQILSQIMGQVMGQDTLGVYDSMMNAPEIVNASNQIKDVEQELITVGEQINGIQTEVEKTLPAWVPASIIAGEVANRQKWLYTKVTALEARRQSLNQNYNRMVEMATRRYEVYAGEQKAKQDFMMKVYGVASEQEIRYEDMQREDQRLSQQIQLEEVNYQRDIARQDYLAAQERKQRLDDMKEERSYNENLAIDKALMEVWINPVWKTLDEKKGLVSAAMRMAAQAEPKWDWVELKNGGFLNRNTWETKNAGAVNSKYGFTATPSGWMQVNIYSTDQVPPGRRQCGAYVNDVLYGWPKNGVMGNSIEDKLNTKNIDKPVAGSAFIMDFGAWEPAGPDGIRNGHTGIVEEVRNDGIVVSDMNRQGTEEFTRRFIPYGSKEYGYIKWYHVPPGVGQLWTDEQNIVDSIDSLLSHPGLNAAVWFWWQKIWAEYNPLIDKTTGFVPGTEAFNFARDFNALRDLLAKPGLEWIKWAMSDKDLEFLRNTATSGNLGMSESAFKAELNRIREKILKKIGGESSITKEY